MIEISKLDFKSVITAKEAMVMPMAKEPELPTKILPRTLKAARASHRSRGPSIKMKYDCDKTISPIRIMAGHTVSNPFSPPSMFMVFVTIMMIKGIIRK